MLPLHHTDMDAGTGLEPVLTESKSAFLPLEDPAIIKIAVATVELY